jgi:hypothetical protein
VNLTFARAFAGANVGIESLGLADRKFERLGFDS